MGFQRRKISAYLIIFENNLKNCYKAGHRHRVYVLQANSKDEGGQEERWDWTYSNIMLSTRLKGTQIKRCEPSRSLGSGVKFPLMALSFCRKATWQRSLLEGAFQFRNVQCLQILWWITTRWNLRGWVITFGFLPASREVQKVTLMGTGKISNPFHSGISVLNRIKVREEGEGKNKEQQLWGNYGTNRDFLGLLNASNLPCEWKAIFTWKNTWISKTFTQLFYHSCSRSDLFSHSLQSLWRIRLPLVKTLAV